MEIFKTIERDLITAMKEKNEENLSLLRMLKSSLKNKEIEIQKELSDDIVIDVLKKEAKKRKETAEVYRDGGREELAEKEMSEYEFIKKYLPEEMSEDDVRKNVQEILREVGTESSADMGKTIGIVMGKLKGLADGSLISKIVKEELNK